MIDQACYHRRSALRTVREAEHIVKTTETVNRAQEIHRSRQGISAMSQGAGCSRSSFSRSAVSRMGGGGFDGSMVVIVFNTCSALEMPDSYSHLDQRSPYPPDQE
jgi:hypothetical protein